MGKTNTQTTESTETQVAGFDLKTFFIGNGKNKSKAIKHMATLPEFQKGDKVDMGKINKAFNDLDDETCPAPKMRYQFVRNVLTAKPKKA
jgi:hypothetical protein